MTWEVIFVDDGSTDDTWNVLERAAFDDQHVKMLRFSRNFGHQAAVTAGSDFANGNAVVVMDADLQDPPELLPRMLDLYLPRLRYRLAPEDLSRSRDNI